METDIVILGKGDAIVCMVLDNLNSNGIYGNISIYNNLSLPILREISHPDFNLDVREEIDIKQFKKYVLGVYDPKHKMKIIEKLNPEMDKFQSILFKSEIDHLTHVALVKGDLANHIVDVRVHRQRPLLDVLSHPEQGDRSRIEYALRMLRDHSHAVVLYLSHPDPQLAWKADFNNLIKPESQSADVATSVPQRPWTEMDPLQLGVGAQILRHLGVRQMRVHMSRATPLKGLAGFGLEVVSTVQLPSGQA